MGLSENAALQQLLVMRPAEKVIVGRTALAEWNCERVPPSVVSLRTDNHAALSSVHLHILLSNELPK